MQNETDADHDEKTGDAAQQASHPPHMIVTLANRLAHVAQWEKIRYFIGTREPKPLATFFAALGVCLLIGLGTWQVMRLAEKNALLEQVQKSLAQAPVILGEGVVVGDDTWRELNYQSVELHGFWMPLRSFRLAPRSYDEQRGYHWIMPFRLKNGQVVLVNRGFVRDGVKPVPPSANEQQLSGVAWLAPAEKPRYAPENNPAEGEWVWLDVHAMGDKVGVGGVAPVVVYENRNPALDDYPIGGQLPLPFHNRHQQYALTWYCLALALIGVWLVASGPNLKSKDLEMDGNSNKITNKGDVDTAGKESDDLF